jgi:hypothetical protein
VQSIIPTQKKRPRTVLWVALVLEICILIVAGSYVSRPGILPVQDFVAYWGAARLTLIGGNPYDPGQLWPLEISVGSTQNRPEMLWNPPWTLPLMLPFGLFAYPAARLLALLVDIPILLFCASSIWKLYGGSRQRWWPPLLISITFVPALILLKLGQSGLWILLGVLGFLHFERRGQGFWAGASLILAAIKPQLLYLLWIGVLLWAIDRRKWTTLLGMLVAAVIGTAIPLAFNPGLLGQYVYTMTHLTPVDMATGTIGSLLRVTFGIDKYWLGVIPSVIGTIWLLYHWYVKRKEWDWTEEMPILLLVCIATTAYGWVYDAVVLLVPILQVAVWLCARKRPSLAGVLLIILYLGIDVLCLLPRNIFWHFWLGPALLICYLVARKTLVGETLRKVTAGDGPGA